MAEIAKSIALFARFFAEDKAAYLTPQEKQLLMYYRSLPENIKRGIDKLVAESNYN